LEWNKLKEPLKGDKRLPQPQQHSFTSDLSIFAGQKRQHVGGLFPRLVALALMLSLLPFLHEAQLLFSANTFIIINVVCRTLYSCSCLVNETYMPSMVRRQLNGA